MFLGARNGDSKEGKKWLGLIWGIWLTLLAKCRVDENKIGEMFVRLKNLSIFVAEGMNRVVEPCGR